MFVLGLAFVFVLLTCLHEFGVVLMFVVLAVLCWCGFCVFLFCVCFVHALFYFFVV